MIERKQKFLMLMIRTIIELNLGFDRAWSAVSRALECW